jgi:hypothetical protein
MNVALANVVAVVHTALVIFFALGWALPWQAAWWGVLVGGIALITIWRSYSNNCPLTVLEARLRGLQPDPSQPRFVGTLVQKFFRMTISNQSADAIAHGFLIVSMIIAVLRLA